MYKNAINFDNKNKMEVEFSIGKLHFHFLYNSLTCYILLLCILFFKNIFNFQQQMKNM